MRHRQFGKTTLLSLFVFSSLHISARAETPDEWIALARRVHGGFGTYLPLGIRIGLHAKRELKARPRELDVTYFDGPDAPCACVADGVMLATGATPGQNSLRIAPTKSDKDTFGIAVIKNKRTGRALRYTIPLATRASLDKWNKEEKERGRYDRVMAAPQSQMFMVQVVKSKS